MEVEEIRSSRKVERARVIAILDGCLALSMLMLCGFTFTFIYAVNDETATSEVLYFILAAPFTLNSLQLIAGILLLCLTRKNTRHLGKCRVWCYTAKFLSALIILEIIVLVHWEFRALALGLFGMQYLIRVSAIRKQQIFMQNLIRKNPTSPDSGLVHISQAVGNFDRLTNVSCAVNSSTTEVSAVTVLQPPDVSPSPLEWNIPEAWIQTPETPPPTYREAMDGFSSSPVHNSFTDPPPSYQDVRKQKARNYWRYLADPVLHSRLTELASTIPDNFPPPAYV